jgi:hypothetical protein
LTPFGLRLASAFVGIATVPLIYRFTKNLLRSQWIALLAASFAAFSYWHVFFSRDGLRVILVVPLTLLMFWALWVAVRGSSVRWYAIAGLILALALYTYPSARLLPIAIIFVGLFAIWNDKPRAKNIFLGTALLCVVTAMLVAPLGIYFAMHPDEFISHTVQVSVVSPDAANQNVVSAIWNNLLRVGGMFFVSGDKGLVRNLSGLPVFDPIVGVLFLVGLGMMLYQLFKPRESYQTRLPALVLVVWLVISLVSSVFSDDAPNFIRTLPALPVVMILPAWGAVEIWHRIPLAQSRGLFTLALFGVVAYSAALTFHNYFDVFPKVPSIFYDYNQDKVEVANWIVQNAPSAQIFAAPLDYQHGTIAFLTRLSPLKSFDSRDTIILPTRDGNQDAYYTYPPSQEQRIRTLADRLGVGERVDVVGSNGAPILLTYHVGKKKLPDAANPLQSPAFRSAFTKPLVQENGSWNGEIRLFGARIEPQGAGGKQLTVTLDLQALKQITQDLTFSVKVRDVNDNVVGQEDKMLGDNSFSTLQWAQNEIAVERFYPEAEDCPAAGDYSITAEIYEPKTGAVLAVDGSQTQSVQVGTVQASEHCSWVIK